MIDRRKLELVACAAAAFGVVFFGVKLLHPGAPQAASAPAVSVSSGPPPGEHASSSSSAVVSVAGEVRRPGVYRLPAGARGADAVRRAGGLTRRADLAAVNLAARVADGQQVVVPRVGAAPAAGGATPGAAGHSVSLSSASAEQLDSLDGIGPTLAQRIVAYRTAHGGFRSIDELRQVEGIGDKRFQALKKALQP